MLPESICVGCLWSGRADLGLPSRDSIQSIFSTGNVLLHVDTALAPITELRQVDRDARKLVTEGGGKHPCGTTSLLYLPRDKGGRGLRSVETECKETKVKAAVKLYQNRDPAMKMVREFEEQAESKGYQSMTKEAGEYAEEYGLKLQLNYPDPVCVTEEGEVVPGDKLKTRLRKLRESRMEGVVEEQKWQGKLITARV